MAPRILLIGGNAKHFHAAKAAGLDVVYVQFPDEFKPEYGPQVVGAVLADYTDWDTFRPLAEAAHRAWGFTEVVSLTEPGLDPAGRVRDLLGLGGPSYEVSHRFTDKYVMRRRLAAVADPDVPAIGAEVMTDSASLTAFGARYGYPFIVKPGAGTASFGVHRVDSAGDVPAVYEAISSQRDVSDHPFLGQYDLDEYVMEEYIDGTLYSAEAFSFAGRHTVLAITEAVTLPGTVVHAGHAVPARLPAAEVAAVERMIPAFLDALGYADGPSHTEFKFSPRGPVVIESQNRIGGALINEMVHEVHGVDMHELTMKWPHGLVNPVSQAPQARGAAASWLAVAQPGEIVEIAGVEEVTSDPATLAVDLGGATAGDRVRSLDGSWDGLGHVAVRAPDTTAAIEYSRARVADIKVHTRAVAD
ncbi:ATP-grasp domain-containing protein [Amycolatopsis sp.]|uniref:ATP-grasp domain-containing protein n=1 Tax=Amycolatopsis sp. TaxID=37632 RepID=UPI002D7E2BA9|nr:ATP-grasp domain-containing protein [Amycolatopsis sp.]HET6706971.1 ATP-grasp domain-containing protein [Amycolatopsis sp.]